MRRRGEKSARADYRRLHWGQDGSGAVQRLAVADPKRLDLGKLRAADPSTIDTATELGELVELGTVGAGGKPTTLAFKRTRPRLAVCPKLGLLLVAGGSYTLPRGMRWTVKTIVYRTRKGFDRDPVEYEHAFSRPYPVAIVEPKSGRLVLAGGRYTVETRGIVN